MQLEELVKDAIRGFNDEVAIGTPPIFGEVKDTIEIFDKTYEVWCTVYSKGSFIITGEELKSSVASTNRKPSYSAGGDTVVKGARKWKPGFNLPLSVFIGGII